MQNLNSKNRYILKRRKLFLNKLETPLYSLRFKMFDTLDFSTCLTVCLIKKNCEICKTICVHESIFNNESNDMKRINNYLIFLNKTNDQTRT